MLSGILEEIPVGNIHLGALNHPVPVGQLATGVRYADTVEFGYIFLLVEDVSIQGPSVDGAILDLPFNIPLGGEQGDVAFVNNGSNGKTER